jgi:hypothetical protein
MNLIEQEKGRGDEREKENLGSWKANGRVTTFLAD